MSAFPSLRAITIYRGDEDAAHSVHSLPVVTEHISKVFRQNKAVWICGYYVTGSINCMFPSDRCGFKPGLCWIRTVVLNLCGIMNTFKKLVNCVQVTFS